MPKRDGQDDFDISLATMFVVVGTVLTFVIVVFLSAVFYRAETSEVRRKIKEAPQEIQSLRAAQNTILDGYRWIDREAGVVAIPIDRAMEIMIEREAAEGGGD